MREIRPSSLEGGVRLIPHPYPYQKNVRCAHSLISRLELGERRVDVVEFFWICQACGADPARTASSLMRQFAKMQAESPGNQ